MEECEVEILEPQDNWLKELPVQVEVRHIQVPVQEMIVNNERKVVYADAYALVCPKCNTIIQQFQPGLPEVEIIKSLDTDDEALLNKLIYCTSCGQRLRIMRPLPIQVETELVAEN